MRDTERKRKVKTQAEGEAGSMQGARCGTRSWVPRITPQASGGAQPLHHQGCPMWQWFKTQTLDSEFLGCNLVLLTYSVFLTVM